MNVSLVVKNTLHFPETEAMMFVDPVLAVGGRSMIGFDGRFFLPSFCCTSSACPKLS